MVEIERKYLINTKLWKPKEKGTEIKQGYLSVDPERTVRVRIAGENAYLTIKGKATGITRTELEYKIPKTEAEVLMKICLDFPVEKTRYNEKIGSVIWEIDVFEGANKGLVIAEIELTDENQEFDFPDWIGEEVSLDSRYYNAWISRNPFSKW